MILASSFFSLLLIALAFTEKFIIEINRRIFNNNRKIIMLCFINSPVKYMQLIVLIVGLDLVIIDFIQLLWYNLATSLLRG